MMKMLRRRRLKSKKWALVRAVCSVCAVCLFVSQCASWVQVLLLQVESEQIYRQTLNLRKQACLDAYPPQHNNHNNNNNNNDASSSSSSSSSQHLFFKACHANVDLNPLPPPPPPPPHESPPAAYYYSSYYSDYYRLGLPTNFTCLEGMVAATNPLLTSASGQATKGTTDPSKRTTTTPYYSKEKNGKTNNYWWFPFFSNKPTHLDLDALKTSGWDPATTTTNQGDDYGSCHGHVLVPGASPVPSVPFGDPCLKRFVEGHCYDAGVPVPRLVHYVWFGKHPMDLITFLSVLAAYRFLQPCLVLFHADSVPQGGYWRALASVVPVLLLVQRSAPVQVFGRALGAVQHKSDIARLEALKEYGGIYLDGDQVVLRSLDEFRQKEFVMGHENVHNLANSLLVSAPRAKFIDVWYKNYRSYNPRQWGIHSTFLPLTLARVYPNMIHNAGYAFIKPDLPGIHEVWEGHYNWTENHALHLYYRSMVEGRQIRTDYTLGELLALNSSLGEIARHVVFGSKDACLVGG